MREKKKKTVVPRLRFPEFRDAGPWEVKRLGDIAVISSGLTADQTGAIDGLKVTRIETISDGRIDPNKVGYIEKTNDIEQFKLKVGDILFSHINSQSHIGKTAFVEVDHNIYHGMNLLRIKTILAENDPRFTYYLLNTRAFRESIRSRSNQAVNQASINQTELGKSRVVVPNKEEQKKITDCLASLDDLIRAEEGQLAALNDHKKGLMQQLFPREGEITPRRRFPEFRDAGPWEVKRLGDVGKISTGKTPLTGDQDSWNGEIPWITPTDINDAKRISNSERKLTQKGAKTASLLPKDTVLVTCIASIGKNAILDVPGSCNQQINAIIPKNGFNPDFIFYLIEKNSIAMTNLAGGSSPAIIPKSEFERLRLPFPDLPEQQKIADCLSSLDELIRAQGEKIEALQQHKKGLMQQLFPQEVG